MQQWLLQVYNYTTTGHYTILRAPASLESLSKGNAMAIEACRHAGTQLSAGVRRHWHHFLAQIGPQGS